jgi:hypothetical protein
MAKVITFSQTFPDYHPKKGQPTNFVVGFHKSLFEMGLIPQDFYMSVNLASVKNILSKHHTIRKGNRFKKGDFFSPRVWGTDVNPKSGRSGPYHSKQIILAPDTQIKKVWKINISAKGAIYIDNIFTPKSVDEIANNDGLCRQDFDNWFNKLPFEGQIICWNDEIDYTSLVD